MATKKQLFVFKDENEPVNFGIYKNSDLTIGELIDMYPEYVTWCLQNWKSFKLHRNLKKRYLAALEKKNKEVNQKISNKRE